MADHRDRVRIGDAERREMTDTLRTHLGAGRLDMPEFERRVEHATKAVYAGDLDGLLDDLPPLDDTDDHGRDDHRDRPGAGGGRPGWTSRVPRRVRDAVRGVPGPLLVAGLVVLALATKGFVLWFLFPLFWFVFLGKAVGGCSARGRRGWWQAGASRSWGPPHHGHRPDRSDHDLPSAGGDDEPDLRDGPVWPGRYTPRRDDVEL